MCEKKFYNKNDFNMRKAGADMDTKRILTIQDISGVGQCSLTVALPIISVCGIETSVLPTAVLSTHTGGFTGFTFRDLTEDIPSIQSHWQKENITFDAIYTGYLGSKKQVEYVIDILKSMGNKNSVNIIDPAMADKGKLYTGFDQSFADTMKKLVPHADFLLPNITEACFLTDTPYNDNPDEAFIKEVMTKLYKMGAKTVILTGEAFNKDKTGAVIYDGREFLCYEHQRLAQSCHGTGDIYASAFTGSLMRGKSVFESVKIAADFVVECIKITIPDKNHTYGAKFEPVLYKLHDMLK